MVKESKVKIGGRMKNKYKNTAHITGNIQKNRRLKSKI